MIPKDEINSRKQEKVSLNFIPDCTFRGRAGFSRAAKAP
jgi:nuclear transport factor 2 (NTF2) superfamily protein